MPEPHELLDGAMNERRLRLRMNWREVSTAAGISYEALRAIRRGDYRPTELTARAIEGALVWAPGSVYALLDGDQATPLEAVLEPVQDADSEASNHLTPGEALRRLVRSAAQEFGVQGDALEDVFRGVRQDLEANQATAKPLAQTPLAAHHTDLSDMVREARLAAGFTLEDVAALTSSAPGAAAALEVGWLDRLEHASLTPDELPEYPQLDALAHALNLDPGQMQEAAGVQFLDVHTVWSGDGQARALVVGELSAEDQEKVQVLMRLYRRAPKK